MSEPTAAPLCGIEGCRNEPGHPGEHWTPQTQFREEQEAIFLARKHDGKNPYATKADAKRIAAMTTTTFGGRRKLAYRCPVCDQWHVGADSR